MYQKSSEKASGPLTGKGFFLDHQPSYLPATTGDDPQGKPRKPETKKRDKTLNSLAESTSDRLGPGKTHEGAHDSEQAVKT